MNTILVYDKAFYVEETMSTQQPINNTTETATIAILGLPVGSALSFDGHTIKLQRDDFVGIQGIPVDKNEDAFHLITVRGGVVKSSNKDENNGNAASITVGFILSTFGQQSTSSLALARKFDPITEEVSSTPLDDMTTSNLCSQIQNQQIEPQRMVSFANAFPTEQVEHWKSQTNYISAKLLQKRGISNGTKIVAGSYGETEETSNQPKKLDSKEIIDGTSVAYPAIPVIDSRKSARHSRHAGTKKYLASLSPSERTALFLDSNPHNYVIEDVLRRYYDNRSEDILGDVQLAYTLFLHLQCLLSLETW